MHMYILKKIICYIYLIIYHITSHFYTMFASGDVNVLTKSGMDYSLEDLEASQDFDGVGGKRETITPTNVMRES